MTDHLHGVKVGDELLRVLIRGHEKFEVTGTVTAHKVGPKLVQVPRHGNDPSGKLDAYRIDTGRINDSYGHTQLWLPKDWEAQQRREELEEALKRHGVEVWRGGPKSIRTLEKLLAVMEEAE